MGFAPYWPPMRNRFKNMVAMLLCLVGCTPAPHPQKPEYYHWAAYYDTKLPAEAFSDLDLVVFDRRYHPDFRHMKENTVILAYVSMGEVYGDVPEKHDLENDRALLTKNPNWNSHAVDLTSEKWRRLVLGYVDYALAHGFDGVMLDTVDSPLEWARATAPNRQVEMQKAAVSLIHAIREKYPDIKIMLNRGFQIAPQVIFDIDYLLAESVLSYKDELTGQYRLVASKDYSDAVGQLHTIIARTDKVRVLTLDYWDMNDGHGVDKLYAMQRAAGFHPYVTTPDLHHFTPEHGHP